MNRISFIVDGFNLYHSVKVASRDLGLGGKGTKWLDIRAFCASYIPIFGKNASLQDIYYFSALATHIDPVKPDTTLRHRVYLQALEASGVIVEMSRFKSKEVTCPACRKVFIRHEEKETDVAVGSKLLELVFFNRCDTAVLITGDTDLAPAVRTAKRMFPSKDVCFAFPYRRKNKELAQLAAKSFRIKRDAYVNFQFPDPVVLPNGSQVSKPPSW